MAGVTAYTPWQWLGSNCIGVAGNAGSCCSRPAQSAGALTDALANYEGAVVVISHDRSFAEGLHATHVAYVNGGAVTIQERPLNADDWRDDCTEPDADFCDTGDLDYSEGGASGVGGGERLSK